GPAARSGRVTWVGKPEPSDLGGTVMPHGIAFGEALERAFVEAVVTQGRPQDPRAPVEVQVDYETVVSGRSVNLSRSGLFIRTAQPLPVSRTLSLRFHLPGIAEPFQVQGEVIWSNPKPGKSYPQGMGVKFVDLPGEGAEQLGAFVAQVRRERGLEKVTDLFGRAEAQPE
ncbi:MAG: TIGR02266 family protein, partial [Candidatus Methylomirabilales bacterium]